MSCCRYNLGILFSNGSESLMFLEMACFSHFCYTRIFRYTLLFPWLPMLPISFAVIIVIKKSSLARLKRADRGGFPFAVLQLR